MSPDWTPPQSVAPERAATSWTPPKWTRSKRPSRTASGWSPRRSPWRADEDAELVRLVGQLLAVRARRGTGRLHPGGDGRGHPIPSRAGRSAAARRAEAAHRRHGHRRHTVLEIVTDDMPFLVDSVTAAAHRPPARRPPAGPPADRGPPRAAGRAGARSPSTSSRTTRSPATWWRAGSGSRSTRSATTPCVEQLRNELRRVLTDVREAVEDWPRMRQQALGARRRAAPRAAAAGAGQGHHRLDRAAALAGRRPLHVPRLPRVPLLQGSGRASLQRGARHRPGHPARRPAARRGCSAR